MAKKKPPMDRTEAFVWQSPDEVELFPKEELERIKNEREQERRKALEDERLDKEFERQERELARRRAPWAEKYLGRMTEMIAQYRRGEIDLPTLAESIAHHYWGATEADPDDWSPGRGLDDELDDALDAGMLKEEGHELVENEELWLSEAEYAEVWDAINERELELP